MADTRYTIIGMSNSGKTCYIAGSYMTMSGRDVANFSLRPVGNATTKEINNHLFLLNDESAGDKRFPVPTPTDVDSIRTLEFDLLYGTEKVINYNLIDYSGGSIAKRDSVYEELKKSISVSTVLYVLVDGKVFCYDDQKKRERTFQMRCAMQLHPLLQDYCQEHGETLPPIVFVVTKTDLIKKYVKDDNEISTLISGYFKTAFSSKTPVTYIVGVTLGENISDDNYQGEFEPVNMHLPILIGSYHEFYNRYMTLKMEKANEIDELKESMDKFEKEIKNANEDLRDDAGNKRAAAATEEKKWKIFRNKSYLNQCLENARKSEEGIRENERLLELKKKDHQAYLKEKQAMDSKLLKKNEHLLDRLGVYLEDKSTEKIGGFMTFVNGVRQSKFVQLEK